MIRQRKILIMDEEESYIKALAELLTSEGFEVLKALTIEETEQVLRNTWVHMMIVDLNMKGGDDNDDRSGLEIVNNPNYMAVPKVILTGYADDPKVLRQMIDERHLVVGFLGKGDGDIHDKIIKLFNGLPFNWSLQILWTPESLQSLLGLAGLFISGEERMQVAQRIDELEDLFCKIFLNSQQVTVGRLFAYQAGVAWLEVTTHEKSRSTEQFMVACGQKQQIKQQMCHYDLIPQGNTIRRVETFETLRFAATLYECLGRNLAELTSLQNLFLRWPFQAIEEAINNLYRSTLASWHKQHSSMNEIGHLRQLYEAWPQKREPNLDQNDFAINVKELCNRAPATSAPARIGYSPAQLTLYLSNEVDTFPNPMHFLFEESMLLNTSLTYGIAHGHLYPSNILIDFQKHSWLIDFSQVQEAPLLLDFIVLEAAFKAELLNMVSIELWYTIEKRLLAAKSLQDPVIMDDLSPEAQKILKLIGIIRERAASTVNQSLRAYLAGLFVHAMTQVAMYDQEKPCTDRDHTTYLYHLISAAMICQQLTSPREFVPNFVGRFVIVEGEKRPKLTKGKRPPKLAQREWDLLKFIHDRVGQPCDYKDILKDVYQDALDDIDDGAWMARSGRPKVNAAIGRLREKLEPDPQNPKYILTEREYGYKLEI